MREKIRFLMLLPIVVAIAAWEHWQTCEDARKPVFLRKF